MPGRSSRPAAGNVFLNVPYDEQFRDLFLAYVAGLSAFGLRPRATLEIPGGERRLDRIIGLVKQCESSVHDLSRVELDRTFPPTPRFNMPFELGIAVAFAGEERRQHTFFVFESKRRRVEKSLSDLSGTDVYIHRGLVSGIFQQLGNAFVNIRRKPQVRDMQSIYGALRRATPDLLKKAGAQSVYEARIFSDIRTVASVLSRNQLA